MHNYKGFLGVLRPINQNLVNGYSLKFSKGVVYTTQVILKVRKEPSISAEQVQFENLTDNAKSHAFSSGTNKGCLYKGTHITCLDYKQVGNNLWIKIPSGWICGVFNGKEYIK